MASRLNRGVAAARARGWFSEERLSVGQRQKAGLPQRRLDPLHQVGVGRRRLYGALVIASDKFSAAVLARDAASQKFNANFESAAASGTSLNEAKRHERHLRLPGGNRKSWSGQNIALAEA